MNLQQLSPDLLRQRPELSPDFINLSALPEKVIQFGTGVLLRGLPDYFIHNANQKGVFNGRIVVVKSTDKGGVDAFSDQANLFTHCVRGIENGRSVEETLINSAISRTLSARTQWADVLECARNPAIEIVISNTTEVGIQYVQDDLTSFPPASFPGKLTAYLYERFKTFNGSQESGMVIVPTELIVDNGSKLREIVLRQARENALGEGFVTWLENANDFCSSLVDRIVPGQPDSETLLKLTEELGYQDHLLIMSEVYRLWAIQGNEKVKEILSFAQTDPGVIIEPDIDLFRELKLRLLNGTHTLASGLCFLHGLNTVRESMENPETASYIADVMLKELAPAIPYEVELSRAQEFGNQVLDRFRNPFIKHQLIDITVQYTAKMKMRNVPTLLNHYRHSSEAPLLFAKGFAAFLLFMKATEESNGQYFGTRNGEKYPIRCDSAGYFYQKWSEFGANAEKLADAVLADTALWGADLSALNGFADAVKGYLSVN